MMDYGHPVYISRTNGLLPHNDLQRDFDHLESDIDEYPNNIIVYFSRSTSYFVLSLVELKIVMRKKSIIPTRKVSMYFNRLVPTK